MERLPQVQFRRVNRYDEQAGEVREGTRTAPVEGSEIGCLSVVMPCYNEAGTILQIVEAVLASPYVGQLVIVDDCSTDSTPELLDGLSDDRIVRLRHDVNQGKGAALRDGFAATRLEFVIVQDADLEYNPNEYGTILAPLLDGRADVVYGSRFKGGNANRVLYFWHSVGNRFLTTLSNMMTNVNLTDMETCFKAFRRDVIESFTIEERRFGVEPEITAKVAQLGCVIYEVGITYDGRTYADGKKIGWKDGLQALFCIVAYSPAGRRLRLNRWSPHLSRLTVGRR